MVDMGIIVPGLVLHIQREEEKTSRVSWFRNGWNVEKTWLESNLACNKQKPSLDSWTTIKISVMISPILTNPVRKFVDPAVFYWTSPLLYIGKKYVLSHPSHHHPIKKPQKWNGLATHWVPTLGGAAEVSNEFSIRPYLVQQETIRGIKFTFRPTRSRGVGDFDLWGFGKIP